MVEDRRLAEGGGDGMFAFRELPAAPEVDPLPFMQIDYGIANNAVEANSVLSPVEYISSLQLEACGKVYASGNTISYYYRYYYRFLGLLQLDQRKR